MLARNAASCSLWSSRMVLKPAISNRPKYSSSLASVSSPKNAQIEGCCPFLVEGVDQRHFRFVSGVVKREAVHGEAFGIDVGSGEFCTDCGNFGENSAHAGVQVAAQAPGPTAPRIGIGCRAVGVGVVVV